MTEAETSDEQLLRRFIAGDRDAMGELAGRYERGLLGLACGLLNGRRDLACDAVQESWLRVIRYGASFNGKSGFKTWMYRIVVNQCRTIRSTVHPLDRATDPAQHQETSGTPPNESRDDAQALLAAVERLAADKRESVLLRYHTSMTQEQASEVLQVPVGTLKSRLHSAMEDLRRLLSAMEAES